MTVEEHEIVWHASGKSGIKAWQEVWVKQVVSYIFCTARRAGKQPLQGRNQTLIIQGKTVETTKETPEETLATLSRLERKPLQGRKETLAKQKRNPLRVVIERLPKLS